MIYMTPLTTMGVASNDLVTPVWIMATGRSCATLALVIWVSGEKR